MQTISESPIIEIPDVMPFTKGVFLPLLEAKRAEIESVPRKTFKFGGLDRNQLDVYYPSTHGKAPVLFFVYGGGYTHGDRILPDTSSLVYANIGSYYARQGFLTVIADYRLVPGVTYPGASEDVRDAIVWVIDNAQTVASADVQPDLESIFLYGHSAGASHLATLLFDENILASSAVLSKLRGVILSGGPYTFGPGPYPEFVTHYYGEETVKLEPLGLVVGASDAHIKKLPEILLTWAERELRVIQPAIATFKPALEKRRGKPVEEIIGKGHNHISIPISPGSGEGEEYSEDLVRWMRARLV
ncbi:hypothetical protein PLICRDRAFT_54017 [Plicaturopsis crispa FD-325 SS-3]|nr:hypothetical protein PLICRDRAFT_54017 [Plicaturopsis crispa FD-325 SS-3]